MLIKPTKVIRTFNAYTDFILELACERGIPAKERECTGKDKKDGIPSSEIQRIPEGRYVINATYAHCSVIRLKILVNFKKNWLVTQFLRVESPRRTS